jgi:hypothetical protein
MRKIRQRGGDNFLEDAGLIGLGAYAASRPGGTTTSGFIGNLVSAVMYIAAAVVGVIVIFFLIALIFGKRQHYKDYGVAFAEDVPVPSTVMGELQPVGPTKAGNDRVLTPAGNVIVY